MSDDWLSITDMRRVLERMIAEPTVEVVALGEEVTEEELIRRLFEDTQRRLRTAIDEIKGRR